MFFCSQKKLRVSKKILWGGPFFKFFVLQNFFDGVHKGPEMSRGQGRTFQGTWGENALGTPFSYKMRNQGVKTLGHFSAKHSPIFFIQKASSLDILYNEYGLNSRAWGDVSKKKIELNHRQLA